MGKKFDGQVRTFGNTLATGTLAANDAISAQTVIDTGTEQGFRVLKAEVYVGDERGKLAANEQLVCGLCPSHFTDAEIAEMILADPQSSFDDVEVEKANRIYWLLGLLTEQKLEPIMREINMRWSFPEGDGLKVFVFNLSAGALAADRKISFFGKVWGVWLRD